MWRQQLDGMHLADPVKKLSVKGMDFVMGGRRRFYGGIALEAPALRARKRAQPVVRSRPCHAAFCAEDFQWMVEKGE